LPKALAAIWSGHKQASKIIKDFQPQIVIGTGGYVCLPLAAAAVKSGVPVCLHEQNAFPGLANRLISIWAKAVMLTFAEADKHFPGSAQSKLVLTGLPVRQEIKSVNREAACARLGLDPSKLTVLVVGGSRGAQSINLAMLHVIKALANQEQVQIIHACGQSNYAKMQALLNDAGISPEKNGNIILKPYIDEMEYALNAADLCVGRAGAAFLAEITVCGIPAILIPYPYAAADHQNYNAKSLEQHGAAVVIQDKDLTGPVLLKNIEAIINDSSKRNQMTEASLAAGRPNALSTILEVVQKVARQENTEKLEKPE
jgi:UDP-N-acetylglucosamine--N-acetylmuramyl-(pentapeptide) pyrophosphoryl-undecaprenol N-acetylglucosamine transferase